MHIHCVVGEVRCPLKIQSWQYFESRLVVIAYKRILNFSALQIIKYFMLLVCKYLFHYSLYSFIKKMKINYSLYSYKEESLQECRRRRSNQFNNVLLNVQDRVNCNKITEIREERIANSFILIRPLPVPTSNPQATHLRFSNYLCKTLLQLLNHLGIPLPCVQDSYIPRDKQSLNHNN